MRDCRCSSAARKSSLELEVPQRRGGLGAQEGDRLLVVRKRSFCPARVLGVDHANRLVLHDYRNGEDGQDRRGACPVRVDDDPSSRIGRDDVRTAAVHHPPDDGAVMAHLGPRAFDGRGVTVLPDGPDGQLFAFAGEEQNAGRASRVRNRAEQDLGQAVRGPRRRQRVHDLMRADGVDSLPSPPT